MGCCKASEANFREWFVYVLENIHEYDNDYSKDLAELLPQNWRLANSQKSKTSLNVLQVLHRDYGKLAKLERKEDR